MDKRKEHFLSYSLLKNNTNVSKNVSRNNKNKFRDIKYIYNRNVKNKRKEQIL